MRKKGRNRCMYALEFFPDWFVKKEMCGSMKTNEENMADDDYYDEGDELVRVVR